MIHKKLWIIAGVGLFIGFGLIWALGAHNAKLNGDAISGYVDEGSYYIMTDKQNFDEVSSFNWILNLVLWIATFVFLIGSMIGLGVATFLDVVRPKSRELFGLGGGPRGEL